VFAFFHNAVQESVLQILLKFLEIITDQAKAIGIKRRYCTAIG
jgi:hypothetical protein